MIRIEYEKFVNYYLGLHTNGKRWLKGRFREVGHKGITTEEVHCLNYKDNAQKSYEATLAYFNHTRTEQEPFRTIVSAKWIEKVEEVPEFKFEDILGCQNCDETYPKEKAVTYKIYGNTIYFCSKKCMKEWVMEK
jgi:hypothetical protein